MKKIDRHLNEAFRLQDDTSIKMKISQKLKSKYTTHIQSIKKLKQFFVNLGECSGMYVIFWGYDDMNDEVIDNYYRRASNLYRIRETENLDCTYTGSWRDNDSKYSFYIHKWGKVIDLLFGEDNIDIHEPADIEDDAASRNLCIILGGLDDEDVKSLVKTGFHKLRFYDDRNKDEFRKLNRYLHDEQFNWIGISFPDLLKNIDKIYDIFN